MMALAFPQRIAFHPTPCASGSVLMAVSRVRTNSPDCKPPAWRWSPPARAIDKVVAQVSKPAVSPISQSAGPQGVANFAGWETRDTADLEVCATIFGLCQWPCHRRRMAALRGVFPSALSIEHLLFFIDRRCDTGGNGENPPNRENEP